MTNVCFVVNEDVDVGMLLLAPINACDVVIPVFDCVMCSCKVC